MINLSANSKKLGKDLFFNVADMVEPSWLIETISFKITDNPDSLFLYEAYRLSLLIDLEDYFLSKEQCHLKKIKLNRSWFDKAKFTAYMVAGISISICNGFGGAISVLSIFTSIPAALVFAIALIAGLLSAVIFYDSRLSKASKRWGLIFWSPSTQIRDIYLEQVEQINNIRNSIDNCYGTRDADLDILNKMLTMLIAHHDSLALIRDTYLKSSYPFIDKVVNIGKGVIAFIDGFFAGQALAMVIFSFFITGVSVIFWPITLISTIAGLSALGLYLFAETNTPEYSDSFLGDKFNERAQGLVRLKTHIEERTANNTSLFFATKPVLEGACEDLSLNRLNP